MWHITQTTPIEIWCSVETLQAFTRVNLYICSQNSLINISFVRKSFGKILVNITSDFPLKLHKLYKELDIIFNLHWKSFLAHRTETFSIFSFSSHSLWHKLKFKELSWWKVFLLFNSNKSSVMEKFQRRKHWVDYKNFSLLINKK